MKTPDTWDEALHKASELPPFRDDELRGEATISVLAFGTPKHHEPHERNEPCWFIAYAHNWSGDDEWVWSERQREGMSLNITHWKYQPKDPEPVVGYPKFVRVGHACLRCMGSEYYRDAGCWSLKVDLGSDPLTVSGEGAMAHVQHERVVEVSEAEWRADNQSSLCALPRKP